MREKYESLSVVVLRDLAKARGLKGVSAAKKEELVEMMLAEDEKEKAFAVNAEGTKNIAVICKEIDAKMVYISTDYVFNGKAHTPYTEDDTPSPDSVYGSTKLAGELGVQKFCKRARHV